MTIACTGQNGNVNGAHTISAVQNRVTCIRVDVADPISGENPVNGTPFGHRQYNASFVGIHWCCVIDDAIVGKYLLTKRLKDTHKVRFG